MNDLVYRNDDAVAVNEEDCSVVYKQYNLSHQGILVPGLSLVQHLSDVNVGLYRDILFSESPSAIQLNFATSHMMQNSLYVV